MNYLFIVLLLFFLELTYFKLANKFNIVDKPNERSAHTEITLRGGGVIFWIASLFYFLQNMQDNYLFFTGITIVSAVSFWDDIQSLPNKVRIIAHFLAVSLVLYAINIFYFVPFYGVVAAFVLAIGILNAFNFMDGINGITGCYTIVVLGSFLYVNENIVAFTDVKFIIYPIIASAVFLFFNFRKKAKCFAGDIGSIAIAFWVVYLLFSLIIKTQSLVSLLFISVYGADTIFTILHRLYLKQNIFEAHRLHFYQILCNEYQIQHRLVSLMYAFLQILISFFIILNSKKMDDSVLFIVVTLLLLLIYSVKFFLIKKKNDA